MTQIPDDYIYLDYAASAPLSIEAAQAMQKYLEGGRANIQSGANANSLSRPGREAFKDMQASRKEIASLLGCRADEIIFTSGATEADNAAITGIAKGAFQMREASQNGSFKPNIITTEIEHDAVLGPAKSLVRDGFELRLLNPDKNGKISIEALSDALDENTVLVSIQMANSEIGTIQDIKALADVTHASGALFHTDATQALGKIEIDLSVLGVDAASFSAHKIGGPKGVGALFLKKRTPFIAQMLGGGQESGQRSGTQNVVGIAGFRAALSSATANVEAENSRLKAYEGFDIITPSVDISSDRKSFLPNIVSATFKDIESETLILRFDSLGFAVSGGSACSSMSLNPSHVLTSIGIDGDSALCALRVSMGRYTTEEDIDSFITAIDKVINW